MDLASVLLSFGVNSFFFLRFFLYFSVFFGLMRYSCFELRGCCSVDRKEKPESNAFVRRFRDEAKALCFFFSLFHSQDFGPNEFRWRPNLMHKYEMTATDMFFTFDNFGTYNIPKYH